MGINISELASCDSVAKSDYELLFRLESLNAKRTQGNLIYDPERKQADCVIYVEGSPEDKFGFIDQDKGSAVLSSSENIFIDDGDGEFFVAAANSMSRLLELALKGLRAEAAPPRE